MGHKAGWPSKLALHCTPCTWLLPPQSRVANPPLLPPQTCTACAPLQVFAHSLFDYVDLKMMMAHWTGLEFEGGPQLILKRFSFRWVFVVATAALAAALPFFFDLMAFLGAIGYAPLCFVIPCLMWLRTQPDLGRAEIVLCWVIIAAFVFVGVAAATGAVRSLVIHSSNYHFFS